MTRKYRRLIRCNLTQQRTYKSTDVCIEDSKNDKIISSDIALCAMCKQENRYLSEWVNYHLNLGFSHIYLYDNNDVNDEHLEDALNDEQLKYITIIDFRGKEQKDCHIQCEAYNDCYKRIGNRYSFVCFLDIDEFLTFNHNTSVKDYLSLSRFNKANVIKIHWKCFDDNDCLYYENKPVQERFTRECKDKHVNIYYKSFYRCGLKNFHIGNVHYSNIEQGIVNNAGKPLKYERSTTLPKIDYELAYIRHYCTKSVEEFALTKVKRRKEGISKNRLSGNFYWKYNIKTTEKEMLLAKLLGK